MRLTASPETLRRKSLLVAEIKIARVRIPRLRAEEGGKTVREREGLCAVRYPAQPSGTRPFGLQIQLMVKRLPATSGLVSLVEELFKSSLSILGAT